MVRWAFDWDVYSREGSYCREGRNFLPGGVSYLCRSFVGACCAFVGVGGDTYSSG